MGTVIVPLKLDKHYARRSAAFLAMWKALRSFDGQADFSADPAPSRSREELSDAVESTLKQVAQANDPEEDRALREASLRYREAVERIAAGGTITGEDRQFLRYLGDEGARLSRLSVSRSFSASTPQ